MNRTHSLTPRFQGRAGLATALVTVMLLGVAAAAGVWETKTTPGPATYQLGVVAGGNGKIYAIGGWYLFPRAQTYEYNPIADSWTPKTSMPFGSSSAGVAESGGRIYVIGGVGGGSYTNRVEAYDPATDTWLSRAPMSVSRDLLAAAATNGKIYAIGGRTPHIPTTLVSTVEEYDPAFNTWTTKAPMPTERHYFAAVAANNGKIYAIGGITVCTGGPCNNVSSAIEEYDPTLDKWTTKSCMPVARGAIVAVAAPDDKIYVIGGYNPTYGYLTSVVRYDPQSDTWESGATPTPIVRSQGGAAMGGENIYVMGGVAPGPIYRSEVEQYNPAADYWVVTPSDPTCGPTPDTAAPVIADLPTDLRLEATGPAGEVATWEAPTATDAVDPAPVVTASPASGSTFGLGTTTVTVTATDASGNSSTASFTVTVVDTTPPAFTVSHLTVHATSAAGAVVSYAFTATDAVDGTVPVACVPTGGGTFPIGVTPVSCTATDTHGNPATRAFTVTVFNNAPICVATPSPASLWPPNHRWVPITINGVTDPDGDPLTIAIISIFQDEPTDSKGDGNTAIDGKGIGTSTARVRAERVGNLSWTSDRHDGRNQVRGDGRVYHISFTASDGNGGSCIGEVTVGVPHDRGGRSTPVDGGALYDSTRPTPPLGHHPGDGCEDDDHEKGRPVSDHDRDRDNDRDTKKRR